MCNICYNIITNTKDRRLTPKRDYCVRGRHARPHSLLFHPLPKEAPCRRAPCRRICEYRDVESGKGGQIEKKEYEKFPELKDSTFQWEESVPHQPERETHSQSSFCCFLNGVISWLCAQALSFVWL